MQRTANFHDQITHAGLPKATRVVDDATALDTAIDVLDAYAATGDAPMRRFLRARQGPAPWLPSWHDDLDPVKRERQKAQVLEQAATRGQGVGRGLGNPLIMGAASIGLTEKEDREGGIDQQHVFDRVALLLAAITARLFNRVLGAPDAPLRAIVPTRGEPGAKAGVAAGDVIGGGDSAVGRISAVASASATPMRVANSLTDRVGASPSVRSVACRTTHST
jgi:hypothetical protein